MLMKFDELKSLIDKGRQDGSQLMPLLTNTFEKGRWSNDTLTYGVDLKDAAISILSACTMKTFESAFRGAEADIGFLNRLWLVPAQLDKVIAIPTQLPDERRTQLLLRLGAVIQPLLTSDQKVLVSFTREARLLWTTWYTDFRRRANASETGARVDTYGLRLCVLLAVCDGSTRITPRVVEAVIDMLEWQLVVRAQYFPTIADNATAALEQKIRKVLARAPGQWFKRKDVYHLINGSRVGTNSFDRALEGLTRNSDIEKRTTPRDGNSKPTEFYRAVAE
jgi:hypothetical protein